MRKGEADVEAERERNGQSGETDATGEMGLKEGT